MQFGSGILSGEPPVDGGSCRIAFGRIGVDGSLQGSLVGITPLGQARVNTLNSISAIPSASSGQD